MFGLIRIHSGTGRKPRVPVLLLYLASALQAQNTPTKTTLQGEISQESVGQLSHLWVELLVQGRPIDKLPVSLDGLFTFCGVAVGQYELRVVNSYGDIVHRDYISVPNLSGPLVLRLPKQKDTRPISGSVSVKQLLHPVPSKALKELARAETAFKKGKTRDSINHLQRAIEVYPAYLEAHNNLGVRYVGTGDYEKAAAEFQKAAELDPGAALVNSNLALALVALKRYGEAESAANRAVAADPGSLPGRYALGFIAAARNNCTREAVKNLKKVTTDYSRARLPLAHILACRGDLDEAVKQLRVYLGSPQAENRQQIESWLAELLRSKAR